MPGATVPDPSLVVFAWGNESRADDGAGPALARRLQTLANPRIRLIEDMQLQIEHITEMVPDVPVLFIDASVAIDEGVSIVRIDARPDHSVTTHAVSPQALLELFVSATRQPAPPAFQMHVAGREFGLGEAPSTTGRRATEEAWQRLRDVLGKPSNRWLHELNRLSERPDHTRSARHLARGC